MMDVPADCSNIVQYATYAVFSKILAIQKFVK